MYILLILFAVLIPSIGHAAYLDQGTVLRYEQDGNGAARLVIRFTGDAEDPIVDQSYTVTGSVTFPVIRRWIRATVDELNLKRGVGKMAQLTPSTVVNGLAAAAPAVVPKNVWRAKVENYRQSCTNGFVGELEKDCAALKSDIESTYQTTFLGDQ